MSKPTAIPTTKWSNSDSDIRRVYDVSEAVAKLINSKVRKVKIQTVVGDQFIAPQIKISLESYECVLVIFPQSIAFSANHIDWKKRDVRLSFSLKKYGVDPLLEKHGKLTKELGLTVYLREQWEAASTEVLISDQMNELINTVSVSKIISLETNGLQFLTEIKYQKIDDVISFLESVKFFLKLLEAKG